MALIILPILVPVESPQSHPAGHFPIRAGREEILPPEVAEKSGTGRFRHSNGERGRCLACLRHSVMHFFVQ